MTGQQAVLKFAEEPCVIVGRCADYILRDREDILKVFVYSTDEKRIERAIQEYGIDSKKAKEQITACRLRQRLPQITPTLFS